MLKIIIRSVLGAILGFILYSWSLESSSPDAGYMFLLVAWGIGMGNSITFCLRILGSALNWAANLSIISFFSFGTGIIGFVIFIIILSVVLSIGWLGGWFVLIRDVINELR